MSRKWDLLLFVKVSLVYFLFISLVVFHKVQMKTQKFCYQFRKGNILDSKKYLQEDIAQDLCIGNNVMQWLLTKTEIASWLFYMEREAWFIYDFQLQNMTSSSQFRQHIT